MIDEDITELRAALERVRKERDELAAELLSETNRLYDRIAELQREVDDAHPMEPEWLEWYGRERLDHDRTVFIDGVSLYDRLLTPSALIRLAPEVAATMQDGYEVAGIGESLGSYPVHRLEGGWIGEDSGTGGYIMYHPDGRLANYNEAAPSVLAEAGFDRVECRYLDAGAFVNPFDGVIDLNRLEVEVAKWRDMMLKRYNQTL